MLPTPLIRTSIAALACALCVAAPIAPAAAQPTAEDIRTAQDAFNSGVEKYRAEDYAGALSDFERAHAAVPNPIFLYNVARCQAKLGRYEDAISTSSAAAPLFDEQADQLPPSEATKNSAVLSAWSSQRAATHIAASLAEPPPKQLDIVSVSVTSVGALTTLVGLGIGASLTDDIEELERLSTSNDQAGFDDLKEEVERKQRRARFTTVAGAVILASGITLWVLRRPTEDEPNTARITFGAAPGAASIGLRATF